jgi:hypothetical protein
MKKLDFFEKLYRISDWKDFLAAYIYMDSGKMDLKDIGREGVDWTHLDADRIQLGLGDHSEESVKAPSGSIKDENVLNNCWNISS